MARAISGTSNAAFVAAVLATSATALASWLGPGMRRPLEYDLMLRGSLPLAGLWMVGVGLSIRYFGTRALWMLLGAYPALYWPVWLLFNGIPPCYWSHNCA